MWKIPLESERHNSTWLAWPWNSQRWDGVTGSSLYAAQDFVDRLIRTILDFENVMLLVRETEASEVDQRFKLASNGTRRVELVVVHYNDIWVRDTLPTFARGEPDKLYAINWNFKGWGRRARTYASYGDDARLCGKIAALTGAEIVDSKIVAEGGAFVFDGDRLTVATKSVMFDRLRNPGCNKTEIEEAILAATGSQRVCWLPGDRNEPMTLGHADSMIAFVGKQQALFDWTVDETSADFDVCDYNLRVFREWASREGLHYDIIRIPRPKYAVSRHQCSSYVNFAWVNGAIIVPGYGDVGGDQCARMIVSDIVGNAMPVLTVDMSAIACAGGSVHCVTQQQPDLGVR